MRFEHLEKGKTYYNRVNNTYTEFVVEEISYDEGVIRHNGKNIDIGEVYVRDENGNFTHPSFACAYLNTERNNVYVNYNGAVKNGVAKLSSMPITNNRREDIDASLWYFYENESGDLLSYAFSYNDIYDTYAHAKESASTIVVNLDGSKEEIKGLVELAQLEEDQIKVIKEFKDVIKKMKEHNIVTIGYDVTSDLYFYNGRYVNIASEESDGNADTERLGVYAETHFSKHHTTLLGAHYVNDDSYYQVFFDRK